MGGLSPVSRKTTFRILDDKKPREIAALEVETGGGDRNVHAPDFDSLKERRRLWERRRKRLRHCYI
jgi:hypothetical protein